MSYLSHSEEWQQMSASWTEWFQKFSAWHMWSFMTCVILPLQTLFFFFFCFPSSKWCCLTFFFLPLFSFLSSQIHCSGYGIYSSSFIFVPLYVFSWISLNVGILQTSGPELLKLFTFRVQMIYSSKHVIFSKYLNYH